VPDHPDQSLPGLPFLVTQRAAQIREHNQLMWNAVLSEVGPSQTPSPESSRESRLDCTHRITRERVTQAEFCSGPAQQLVRASRQQPFSRTIYQSQPLLLIKGKGGDVDLLHHRSQKRRRFESAQALLVECLAQCVDLCQHFTKGVSSFRPAQSRRKIPLAKSRQN